MCCLFGLGGPHPALAVSFTISTNLHMNQIGLTPNMPAIQGQQYILTEI
jgi:hypothetical protein